MSFVWLALIAVVGIAGPLLAVPVRWHLPVVLGELLAGLAVGRSGLQWVDSGDPAFTLMAQIGFALLMFVAGTHVPVRDAALRGAVTRGALRALAVTVPAVLAGIAVATAFGVAHAPLYVVLLASSSAAMVLPVIDSLRLTGQSVLELTTQVAVADVAAILALPLVVDPPNAGRAAVGSVVVSACAALLFFGLRAAERAGRRRRVHNLSETRKFALELRIQLALLFALAALATFTHVSIMLAGFSFGLAVAGVGEPRRLARQLFALNDGFLGPLFFVWLGASLNLRDLVEHPQLILLGLALGVGAVLVHAASVPLGLPAPFSMMAAAQLGVPVAAATIGSQLGLLVPGEAAAVILGALVTVLLAVLGAAWSARRAAAANPPA
ncbi:cation:proton antiporter [Paenarthrobacter sp. DKR-5]|uniref:cation:proton antiporter n=1 Tax=Paenarthrobacter sp. DKR-5 TaxID=2835535 RepID=UPI001BDC6638|nr:cation:proton antiporter [Paenarthrobacter sp. DKR-5]MBT1003518.1 cation:proton antiporter [Paenarthrobacter sp. DKR-5]